MLKNDLFVSTLSTRHLGDRGDLTEESKLINQNIEYDWGRMPRPGAKLFSLSRPSIYRLINEGRVRAKRLLRPGAKKGCTFVSLSDLKAVIENAPDAGSKAPQTH